MNRCDPLICTVCNRRPAAVLFECWEICWTQPEYVPLCAACAPSRAFPTIPLEPDWRAQVARLQQEALNRC